MAKLLLVEDDKVLGKAIQKWLSREGHSSEIVESGQEGLERLRYYDYDLAVLDWNLPEISGVEICRQYRNGGGNIPILMLTGNKQLADKTAGLDSGADDYLTKPFEMEELSARLRALLRRSPAVKANILKAGDITLDTVNRTVKIDGREISLNPKEISLLELLFRHPDEVFSQEAILNRVWLSESDVSPTTVRSYIARIRQKLLRSSRQVDIVTAHRIGYRLTVNESADENI